MKLQVLQEDLNKAIQTVSKFTTNRAQLPILGNILFVASKTKLKLSATNLETSASTSIGAKIEEDGQITIPSRILNELIANIGKNTIDITSEAENIKIVSENIKSNLVGMNASDFPKVPDNLNKNKSMSFSSEVLSEMLKKVLFSASNDETRPILTGILFLMEKNKLTLVSTDGFRLSKITSELKNSQENKMFILPKNILSELTRSDSSEEVYIELQDDEKQASFLKGESVYSSRLIEGDYPDYESIIPNDFVYKVSVNREDFLKLIKISGLFARDNANIVKLVLGTNELKLKSQSSQSGSQDVKLEARIETTDDADKKFEISFNYKFIEEFLNSVPGEEIEMRFVSTDKAGVFLDTTTKEYLHLIMPVRV